MTTRIKIVIATLIVLGAASGDARAGQPSSASERLASWKHHVEMNQSSLFRGLQWNPIGPEFMGGRIEAIAVPKNSRSTFYLGAGSGNVWKTRNNGLSWKPIFDNESTFTVGAIAVAPSNPDVVWVGSGEVLMARSSFAGTGVFKSTDGGESWRHMGLGDSHHIGRVLIHPDDPNIVFVAAIGHNYSFNEQRGLFKTTDGGRSWKRVLYLSERAGVIEVVMEPRAPDTLYAVSWQRDRKAWNNVVNGEGSAIHRSIDGGETWTRLGGDLPSGEYAGRFGVAIAPSRPNVVYAIVDNRTPVAATESPEYTLTAEDLARMSREEVLRLDPDRMEAILREHNVSRKHSGKSILESIAQGSLESRALATHLARLDERRRSRQRVQGGEIYRSTDRGDTWAKVNQSTLPTAIGYDFCLVRVSPDDENQIYVLGNYLLRSDDGGRTYERNEGAVRHLEPHDSTVLHLDQHDLWIDPDNGDHLILGNDGGVHVSYDRGEHWLHLNNLPIGEFYAVNLDDSGPDEGYRIFGGTQDDAAVYGPSPWRHVYLDRWGGGDSYFTLADPTDRDIVYYEHQFGRLRRKNLGQSTIDDIMPEAPIGDEPLRYNWMSPFFISRYNPLTLYFGANRLFKSTNKGDSWSSLSPDLSTGPGAAKQGNVPYGTITSLSESPLRQGLIYAGTDDGNVWVTRDDGVDWSLIRDGLPSKWVSRVVASSHRIDTAYVSLTGYREDDFRTYLYTSDDYGQSWVAIDDGLPAESVNVVREDPHNPDVLYVGTDLGVYVTIDRGTNWHSLMAGLPTTPVHDLRVHAGTRELVAGSHGRSMFVLDVAPFRELTARVVQQTLHVFEIAPAQLGRTLQGRGVWEQGPNHDAVVHVYVNQPADVRVRVSDSEGAPVRTFEKAADAGVHTFVWTLVDDEGSRVEPGEYQVLVGAGDEQAAASLLVKGAAY